MSPSPRTRPFERAGVAFAVYLAITALVTWPTVASMTRRLPLDLGDPLLNTWILTWDWGRLLRIAHGDLGALTGFFDAGIFYPQKLALAYSEHLFAQAVQGLPLFALTRDGVLCYNAIFLSTFALSGLGAFLLVRQLTGNARAGFVGGLLYAFAPYRIAQIGHLQVLSSQWMPFVLFGLARWFEAVAPLNGEPARDLTPPRAWSCAPLAWAAVALVAQNLSCGYYLLFFDPVVAAYVLWEVGRRGLWRRWKVWRDLAVAVAVVIAAATPFLLPYVALRQQGFRPRPLDEVMRYSADVYSYLRALDDSIWRGWLPDFTREEGTLFPGLVPVALAGVAAFDAIRRARERAAGGRPLPNWRRGVAASFAALAALSALLAAYELFAGPAIQRIRNLWFPLALVDNVLTVCGAALVALVFLSPSARWVGRDLLSRPATFFLVLGAAAAWLSFGPFVATKGFHLTNESVYVWLYHYLPGFNGLRVPARLAMVVALALAVSGGLGAAVLLRTAGRRARLLVAGLCVLFLAEGLSVPIPLAALEWRPVDDSGRQAPLTVRELDRLYAHVAALPTGTVVAEFPIGSTFDDVRAVFFSIRHGHPIVNGYSGEYPGHYRKLIDVLSVPMANPDQAWKALASSGATSVVVHEWAFERGTGREVSRWLEAHGATLRALVGSSRLYDMPAAPRR